MIFIISCDQYIRKNTYPNIYADKNGHRTFQVCTRSSRGSVMAALFPDHARKKRKVERAVPTLIAETGVGNVGSVATAEYDKHPDVNVKSESTSLNPYHISCTEYSADLDIHPPPNDHKQSLKHSANPRTSPATASVESYIGPNRTKIPVGSQESHIHAERSEKLNLVCPYDEALAFRYRAREIGLEAFIEEFIVRNHIPLQKVYAAFGVTSASRADNLRDSASITRLRKAIVIDMGNRIKLHKYNSVNDAVNLVRGAKNIMVITGAGISTSLKIPDFRSRDGLYPKLRQMGFQDPEGVFSRDTFEQDPKPFFSIASMILPPTDGKFTPAHAFLRLLQDKSKLLRLYTQNIDGIDLVAGISRGKLIQLHGSFETATCTSCGHCVKGEEIFPEIRKGEVPGCVKCAEERTIRMDQMAAMRAQHGRSVRRKTQRSGIESVAEPAGIMRPDIVFMGEQPNLNRKRLKRDCANADLVIVMGTSLPVAPVNEMPNLVSSDVPQIYIGKNQMFPERNKRIDFDIQLLGECDVVAELLAKGCGWDLKHELLPKDTYIEVEPWCGLRHCHLILREKMSAKRKDEESDSD